MSASVQLVRFVGIDGKMHEGAFFELDQGRLGSGYAGFVLLNGVTTALAGS